jgi:hypothetical protein
VQVGFAENAFAAVLPTTEPKQKPPPPLIAAMTVHKSIS